MHQVNPGTVRVTIMQPGRINITGLHVCANCVTILRHAWPPPTGAAAVLSASPWQGPCDLCRYTTALVQLLDTDPATADPETADAP